jgi:two-component system chemotaxis response regulator CheB
MKAAHESSLRDRGIEAVMIGGSAGVLDVLRVVLGGLPATLRIPVVIVIHMPPRGPATVHHSLQSASSLPMQLADDKEPLRGGNIYFASPGYHLLIEADRSAAQSLDEPVYFSRPSIDVLFESASDAYERSVLAILLTGASPDGAQGLRRVHDRGGVTVVQDPSTCEVDIMPQAALGLFQPDFVLGPAQIASLLSTLDSREREMQS